jgi:heme A synthase
MTYEMAREIVAGLLLVGFGLTALLCLLLLVVWTLRDGYQSARLRYRQRQMRKFYDEPRRELRTVK